MKKTILIVTCIGAIVFGITFTYAYNWAQEVFVFELQQDPYDYIKPAIK